MTWIQSRFEEVVEQILRNVVNARIAVYRSIGPMPQIIGVSGETLSYSALSLR